MENIQQILQKNKELFWDIGDLSKINDICIEERFLQYGNWDNIKNISKIFGQRKFKENYIKIKNKKRHNLSKKTINFFNLYLNV